VSIGVFGGAFDPPHVGHVELARAGIAHFGLERLLVRVVEVPGHKDVGTPALVRLSLAQLAFGGVEANFELAGTEYRLGAERHTVDDYLGHIADAGFRRLRWHEYSADDRLVAEVPLAEKHLGRPLLLLVRADRVA